MQRGLHAQQPFGLGLGDLRHRNLGPHRDHFGDVFFADARASSAVPACAQLLQFHFHFFFTLQQFVSVGLARFLDSQRVVFAHRFQVGDHFLQLQRFRAFVHAHARGGFVNKIDGLIRQKTVGDVAHGKVRGCVYSLIGDGQPVVLLVTLFDAVQNGNGFIDGGLLDVHGLEAAL